MIEFAARAIIAPGSVRTPGLMKMARLLSPGFGAPGGGGGGGGGEGGGGGGGTEGKAEPSHGVRKKLNFDDGWSTLGEISCDFEKLVDH